MPALARHANWKPAEGAGSRFAREKRRGASRRRLRNGWGGIRTPGGLAPSAVFKTAALDHSATHPVVDAHCRAQAPPHLRGQASWWDGAGRPPLVGKPLTACPHLPCPDARGYQREGGSDYI